MVAAVFCIVATASLVVLARLHFSPIGWDLDVYTNALRSVTGGHDPYADGIAIQRAFHDSGKSNAPDAMPPYTYVYSPLTLPLLRGAGHFPLWLSGSVYWMLYELGFLAAVWTGLQLTTTQERRVFLLLAPFAAFFPGLLQTNVIFSGNLAYVLYGLVLASAVLGWRNQEWLPFYATVLFASCFKAPMLSLVLIAPLSARRQWLSSGSTMAAGLLLFAVQALLWPTEFHSYLQAVELQFSYNHDFGISPSGLLGSALFYFHLPYATASLILYGVYAVPLLATLFWLSRQFLAGSLTLAHWAPVMLIGVVLLNPRIKEYDTAPLSLPIALVVWRLFARKNSFGRTVLEASLFFLTINAFVTNVDGLWKPVAGLLLLASFIGGVWQLAVDRAGAPRTLRRHRGAASAWA
ncbi:hypothetical protein [Granulicella aggregans]|uniref:hypothetical protein n=1 Tax=Granulicella aggregans TaxID=474949 RepID=UPI0021DF8026|nr:hypothetical protein [Granulicella aggregans]